MNDKHHIFLCGGTGEECGEGILLVRESLALYQKGESSQLYIVYETMDQGGGALGRIRILTQNPFPIDSRDPHTEFGYVEVADKVRLKLSDMKKTGDVRLRDILPPEFQDRLLLNDWTLDIVLSKGFFGDMKAGALITDLALEAAEGSEADRKMGFEAVTDEVLNSNRRYEVRAALIGSAHGSEGRINLCSYPKILREKCKRAVQERLGLQPADAKKYVADVLKIAVIMVGAVFRFPKLDGLNQDVAGLVAGTLQNYPEDTIEALDAFYLLEHDNMPVQASAASYGNDQHKHAHALELVAFEAVEDFFRRSREDLEGLRRNHDRKLLTLLLPHYALPGNAKTNWENLNIPHEHRLALAARLRFDAMLFLWLRPQLLPSNPEKVYESNFLCRMYGVNKASALRKKVSSRDLETAVIGPFTSLLDRERLYLRWILDISLTGRDWERRQNPDDTLLANLFPVREIGLLLRKNPCADINEYGGMTGYNLDRMTACGEGNPYSSRRTPDWIRSRITYRENGMPVPFMKIMEQLYDLCADTTS